MNWIFRAAQPADANRIAELVNYAFQVERAFKNGDRTTAAEIARMLGNGKFVLMERDGVAGACVYVEQRVDHAYIGMLSVAPELQGTGVGSQLLAEVENECRGAGYKALDLRFVHLRTDLRAYYLKRGFVETGIESAASVGASMTAFTVPVHFIAMSKNL
ncbi:MAG TPA: GNAT family N-acetyltransferase [Acidobacteriaceae bacterium]|jgi:N-acetylglutamate synthase-like GNAT family acetyltransferase|nr:GNAT family N-acetyltransferase [Acidobacteriaceae bacterium]